MKLLIVEDDPVIAQTLKLLLSSCGYAVDIAANGEAGLEMVDAFKYDLMLLDVMLPGLSGISMCQQLRAQKIYTPILLLTGQGGGQQKAIALNAGADDYVVKPFEPEELIARVQALLRRGEITSQPILTWGYLSVDPSIRQVTYGNRLLSLTPKEYAILELFLRSPQKTFSSQAILDHVWNSAECPGEEAVRVHIKELRHKLMGIKAPKDLIKTIYRVGYRLNPIYSSNFATPTEQLTEPQVAELKSVNEELRVALEELQIAQEELQCQNEQLESVKQALELEHQRYRDLFEFAPDAYLITDVNGVIQEANDAASSLFCIDCQSLVGKSLIALVAQFDRYDFQMRLANLSFTQNWEININPKGRDPLPVALAVTVVKNLHNEMIGLRWLLHDMRPQKAMEQQLQTSRNELEVRVAERTLELVVANQSLQQNEEFLSSIYDGAEQSILVVDVTETYEFYYTSLNRSAQKFIGVRLQDIQYKTPEEVFGVETGALLRLNYQRCLQADKSITCEEHFTFKERSIWVITTLSPIHNEAGRIHRIVGTVLDINERKHLELSLQASEERYRLMFESNPNPMWFYDPKTLAFLEVNQAAIAHYGYSKEEFLQMTIADIRPSADLPAMRQVNNHLLPGLPHTGVGQHCRKDGSVIDVEIMAYAFPVADKQINLALIKDITDRKQAEIALQQQIRQEYLLTDIAQDIRRSLKLNEVLSRTVHRVREVLNTDRVIIFRFRPNWQGDVIMESVGEEWTSILSTTIHDPCLGDRYVEPYRQGRITALTDIDQENLEPCHVELLQSFQVRANLVVPILRGDHLWGLLIAHHCAAPRQWQPGEIVLLKRLSNQVGIAIQQSELYEQTQHELIERERMQIVLEENEELFRTLSEAAPIGICQINADGTCLYTNARWQEMSGLSFEESLGDGWLRAVHPEDREAIAIAWEAYLQGSSQPLPEFRLLTPGREVRWISARVATMKSTTDVILGYVCIVEEITDRKLAEIQLREMSNALSNAVEGISRLDEQGNYTFVNEAYADIAGYTPEEMIGINWQRLVHPEDLKLVLAAYQRMLNRGKVELEARGIRKDGSVFHKQLSLIAAYNEQQQFIGHYCFTKDISEKKQLESQFYHAQRLESLGTLASGIAHDLNNTLTPILAIAQLLRLKQANLDTQMQEMLQVLEESAKRGASMVKQILTFARGGEGKRIPLQVASLLQNVVKVIQQTFPKSITICEAIPEQPLEFVSADPTYLHQVLMNLCVNARDAMPEGGVLTLSAQNYYVDELFAQANLDAQVGNYVVITVTDTGIGIPPEVRERIFEPFFTTKELDRGTGLGLSTVLGIVKSYRGFLQLFSEIGQGSQFKVYLPTTEELSSDIQQKENLLTGNGERVLIVDDDLAVRQANQSLLASHHYTTLLASDGIEAIALYAKHQADIDVVLMDVMMPNMDGIATIRALQKMNPDVKIIAVSGLPANQGSVLAAGATAFLAKPYTLEELLKQLYALVKTSLDDLS